MSSTAIYFFHHERLRILDSHQVTEVLALRGDPVDKLAPGGIKLCNITQIAGKL